MIHGHISPVLRSLRTQRATIVVLINVEVAPMGLEIPNRRWWAKVADGPQVSGPTLVHPVRGAEHAIGPSGIYTFIVL